MKNHCIVLYCLAVSLCFSCIESSSLDNHNHGQTRTSTLLTKSNYEAYEDSVSNYWSNRGITPAALRAIQGGEEKFQYCQLPQHDIKRFKTRDLAYICITFPLAFDVFLCNDEDFGVNYLLTHFNGFIELFNQEDVVPSIIDLYSSIHSVKLDDQYAEALLERIMKNDLFMSKCTANQMEELRSVLITKRLERMCHSSKLISQNRLNDLLSSLSVLGEPIPEPIRSSNVTRYTPFGQSLACIEYDTDFSNDTISYWNNYVTSHYNVILLGNSSKKYNCHAYAWLNTSSVWMNAAGNLSKFYTNDLYSAFNAPTHPSIAYYYSGDHSAKCYSSIGNGVYVSKWGSGPLVRHTATEVPAEYYPSQRSYYIAPYIDGNDYFQIGQTYAYTMTPAMSYASYEWIIGNDESKYDIISSSGNQIQIQFLANSVFEIYCYLKDYNNTIVYSAGIEVYPE